MIHIVVQLNKTWSVLLIVTFLGRFQIVLTDEESISNHRQFTCCARHEKIINIGHAISGEVIDFDVGQCRKLCPKDVFYDPGDRSVPAVQKCTENKQCRPRSAKIERISTVEGVRRVENIEMCECSTPQYCKRRKFTHQLYIGTPYQTIVDVGLCMGHCNYDLGCKPVKNRTVSIKGPNGNELYHVIEKCGCTSSCYRVDHVETVLDYSKVEIPYGSNSTEIRAFVKQINVGKCNGNCDDDQTETCLIRSKKTPFKCYSGYFVQNTCTPVKYKIHQYRDRRGVAREIIQITECACV